MTLAQADQILDRGGWFVPPTLVCGSFKNPGPDRVKATQAKNEQLVNHINDALINLINESLEKEKSRKWKLNKNNQYC